MEKEDVKWLLEKLIEELNNTNFQLDNSVGKFEFIKYLRKKYLED